MSQFPGLRDGIYLNGANIALGPSGYSPQWSPVETDELLADTSTLTERPLEPFSGAPDRLRKLIASIPWDAVIEGDLEVFEDLDAYAWPIDFADWRMISERFSGDGATQTFTLPRRSALLSIAGGLLPATAAVRYATAVYVDGGIDAGYSVGSADALGRLPITVSALPSSGYGNVLVRYVPLYLVRAVGSDRGYPSNLQESRVLHLREVA